MLGLLGGFRVALTTPPESSLLEMVRELISKGEDRGPIMTQEELGQIGL